MLSHVLGDIRTIENLISKSAEDPAVRAMDEKIESAYDCNSPGGRLLRRVLQPTIGETRMTENSVAVSTCYLLSLTKRLRHLRILILSA
jgi:hypothetical protein